MAALFACSIPAVAGDSLPTNTVGAVTGVPQVGDTTATLQWRETYNTAALRSGTVTVGAKDIIATNTVTITSLSAPTAGYVVATNAIPFFSAAGGKGMLQYVMLSAHTNAALTMHVFRNYPGTATPGSAYDYDCLNKGHLRVCPPLDFSTWTALGTGGASGESFCSAIYGLNIPVTSVDGNLHVIIVAGSSPKAQAGWNSTGTAPIHQIFGGIEDPQ